MHLLNRVLGCCPKSVSQFLLIGFPDCDPILHSGVKPTSREQALLDPGVNDIDTNSKTLSHLLDRRLLRAHEFGGRDLVAMADPPDHRKGERFAQGTDQPFLIESIDDLCVRQALG